MLKKLLATLTAAALCGAMACALPVSAADEIVFGDVSGDGDIDSNDGALILAYYALTLLDDSTETNPALQKWAEIYDMEVVATRADVTKDGAINSNDAVCILEFYAELMLNSSLTYADFEAFADNWSAKK